ncbi:MAG: hypothetical protein H0X25_02435 [Acidobacteriales bacterium]|nr:hypothetical protein [Terriglobales bacterium]
MKLTRKLGLAAATCVALAGMAVSQSWQPLKNKAPFNADTMAILQDGTVLVHQYTASGSAPSQVWKLTPDSSGSYVHGTWTQLASLPSGYGPLYFSEQVLPDGRVIYAGGEYNYGSAIWTKLAAIYNPLTNVWATLAPPAGWTSIGDAQSVVLPNGTYMQANALTSQQALLNASTLTWTPLAPGRRTATMKRASTFFRMGRC